MTVSRTHLGSITIADRFNGPPDSGNGGYVCGRLAAFMADAGEGLWPQIALRRPVPLNTALDVIRLDDGRLELMAGEEVVARAQAVPLKLTIPGVPALKAAEGAVKNFRLYEDHPLPTCFVCGTHRAEGDGLRLFTGHVDGAPTLMVAAPWHPHPSVADEDGLVRPEIIWAALDCPGAFAVEESVEGTGLKLLGTFAAYVDKRPMTGQPYVVSGWHIKSEGRKHFAGTALHTAGGTPLAAAQAIWIELK